MRCKNIRNFLLQILKSSAIVAWQKCQNTKISTSQIRYVRPESEKGNNLSIQTQLVPVIRSALWVVESSLLRLTLPVANPSTSLFFFFFFFFSFGSHDARTHGSEALLLQQ